MRRRARCATRTQAREAPGRGKQQAGAHGARPTGAVPRTGQPQQSHGALAQAQAHARAERQAGCAPACRKNQLLQCDQAPSESPKHNASSVLNARRYVPSAGSSSAAGGVFLALLLSFTEAPGGSWSTPKRI